MADKDTTGKNPNNSQLQGASSPKYRTALGEELAALRQQIKVSGVKMLTWEEIDHEVEERRGNRS